MQAIDTKQPFKQVLVIGLDGATLDLIGPWLAAGDLPNLARLAGQGCYGELRSVIPPITGPAWTTFATGKNPGKHGIFDWLYRNPQGYDLLPISSERIPGRTLWRILSDAGKRVAVLGVPVTYPPQPVNGVIITSVLTPSDAQIFTHPPELSVELRQRFDYTVVPRRSYDRWRIPDWVEELKAQVTRRVDAAHWLWQQEPWDFFMLHILETDMVQHGLWWTIDPAHPDYGHADAERFRPLLKELFVHTDREIGRLLEGTGQEVLILAMSDHGFGPVYKYLYLNNFLLRNGFLRLKGDALTRLRAGAFRLGFAPSNVYRMLMRIGLLDQGLKRSKGERYNLVRRVFLSADQIDWGRSKAYSHGNIGQIYINVAGREPQGCVQPGAEYEAVRTQIIERLRSLQDPQSGEYIAREIYRREELYSGPALDVAPDIVLLPERLEWQAIGVSEFVSNQVVERSFAFSGGHRLNGLLMAAGHGVRTGTAAESGPSQPALADLTPTILWALGQPVPEDIDGRVLAELFEPSLLAGHPVTYEAVDEDATGAFDVFSDTEVDEIKNRLRALGYVN